jgi:hypothetical protein
MKITLPVAASLACLAFVAVTFAATTKIELPPERATLKDGPGAELANGRCLICHSAEYVTTQPPGKPLAFWKAEVEKMRKVYGAPIGEDQVGPIAEYLTRAYGSEGQP